MSEQAGVMRGLGGCRGAELALQGRLCPATSLQSRFPHAPQDGGLYFQQPLGALSIREMDVGGWTGQWLCPAPVELPASVTFLLMASRAPPASVTSLSHFLILHPAVSARQPHQGGRAEGSGVRPGSVPKRPPPKQGSRVLSDSVPQFLRLSHGSPASGSATGRGGCALSPSPLGPAPEAVQKRSRAATARSSLHAVLAMQGPPAPAPAPGPGSPRGSPRGSPGLFRKLLVNQSIRLQRRFTVAHPLW